MLSRIVDTARVKTHQPQTLCKRAASARYNLPRNRLLVVDSTIAATKITITRRRPWAFSDPQASTQLYHLISKQHRTMSTSRSTDPLVWIDCEMTGLDYTQDQVLSISCFVTDHELELLDTKGYHATIRASKEMLDNMSPWCVETHGRTGLTQACLSSTTAADTAATELLDYIKSYVPEARRALLAGNSVHADKMFLMQKPWEPVVEWLHYRLFDVSAMKEAARRWCSDEVLQGVPRKKLVHSAEDDIRESIEEARYYMKLFRRMSAT